MKDKTTSLLLKAHRDSILILYLSQTKLCNALDNVCYIFPKLLFVVVIGGVVGVVVVVCNQHVLFKLRKHML